MINFLTLERDDAAAKRENDNLVAPRLVTKPCYVSFAFLTIQRLAQHPPFVYNMADFHTSCQEIFSSSHSDIRTAQVSNDLRWYCITTVTESHSHRCLGFLIDPTLSQVLRLPALATSNHLGIRTIFAFMKGRRIYERAVLLPVLIMELTQTIPFPVPILNPSLSAL